MSSFAWFGLLLGAQVGGDESLPERSVVIAAGTTLGRLEGVGGALLTTTPSLFVGLRWKRLEFGLEGGGFVGLAGPSTPRRLAGSSEQVTLRLDGPRVGGLLGYRVPLAGQLYLPMRIAAGLQSATTSTPGEAGYVAARFGLGAGLSLDEKDALELEFVALELQMLFGAEQSEGGALSSVLVQTGFRVSYALGF